ncbi:MAG: c-type cytochrome [Anaerolineales bacterium]
MSHRSNKFEKRISILFVIFLILLIAGCGPVKQNGIIQPASAEQIAAGNAEHGRDLFMGYAHFENDGPPCMGCHSVGQNGLLGGGALGPDLTNVTEKRNQTDLASILSNYGWTKSPVMEPIFTAHPLTQSEQADLIAFLSSSVGQPETNKEWLVIGISLAGFVAAVLALGFVYRNRLRGVRRALVNQAQKELL